MKLNAIIATMENLENELPVEEVETPEVAQETATEVAEVSGETNADTTEIESTDAAIEDAFVASDKIDEIKDVAEAAAEGEDAPGLSEGEATMIEITHESILSSLGMSYDRQVYTPESFSEKKSRQEVAQATLESLVTSAKSVIANIVRALKAALNTVMNFIAGLLRNRALMDKHLVNLQAKVKDIDSKAVQKKDKLTAGARILSTNGVASVDTASKILKEGSTLITVSGLMSGYLKSDEAMAKWSEDSHSPMTSALKTLSSTKEGNGLLPASRTIKTVEVEGTKTIEIVESGTTATEIAAPTPAQMSELLNAARKTLGELRAFEKTQTKFKDAIESISKRLTESTEVVKSKFGSEESKAQAAKFAAEKKQARQARGFILKFGGTIPGLVFQSIKGVADYVTAGVNNYKPEAEAKTPAKEEKK